MLFATGMECRYFRKIHVRLQKVFEVLNQLRYSWYCYRTSWFLLISFHDFPDYLSVEHGRDLPLRWSEHGILAPERPNIEFFSFRDLHQELYLFWYITAFCFSTVFYFHLTNYTTLGLSLQKVVLQTLEFCRTRGGARQLGLFSVQGIILKNPEESAEAAVPFSSGSCGCVIQRHGLREAPARVLCGASPLGRLSSQRSFSRTRAFLISSGFLRFYLAAFSTFHPQCTFWHEEFDLIVPPMARVLLAVAE